MFETITSIFLKLLDNSSLTTLVFGVIILFLGGADKIPVGEEFIRIHDYGRILLQCVGLVITALSLVSLFRGKLSRKKDPNTEKRILKAENELSVVSIKLSELDEIIQDIKLIVETRDDDVSRIVLDVINGIKDHTREFGKELRDGRLAAQWLKTRKSDLVSSLELKHSRSSSLNTSSISDEELLNYIDIMIENLNSGKFILPSKRERRSHIGNHEPYIKVIKSLKEAISERISSDPESLSKSSQERLFIHIDRMIDDILYENSK